MSQFKPNPCPKCGSNVSLHDWVKRRKPKLEYCERCGKVNCWIDLSNNSGNYLRDVNDYEWLCRSCHRKKDFRIIHRIRNISDRVMNVCGEQ